MRGTIGAPSPPRNMSQQIDNKGTTDQIEAAPYNAELDRTESLQEKKEDVVSHNIVAADNDMGLLQAIRVFPTATMYSVLGAMTAVSDGFQASLMSCMIGTS